MSSYLKIHTGLNKSFASRNINDQNVITPFQNVETKCFSQLGSLYECLIKTNYEFLLAELLDEIINNLSYSRCQTLPDTLPAKSLMVS